jgi:CubicO group peptidase (beta-lactamase class C family)
LLILTTPARRLFSATSLDEILGTGIARRKIPAAVAMVATADQILYSGAFGRRDSASGLDVTTNAIFAIASMTKAITSVAALQLVEQGRVKLDEPVAKHLPQLASLEVLTGFDKATGKPVLRPALKPVTLRHLLTHTSGFAYPTWSGEMLKYTQQTVPIPAGTVPLAPTPLIFEPGTRWQYGFSTDWAGRLVEAVTGQTLEQYFQSSILGPLGMKDTGFILPPQKFERLVSSYQRQGDGSLKEDSRTLPAPPQSFGGGGGLYSTTGDYVRMMQMILRRGQGSGKERILQPRTVGMMTSNQTGNLSAGKLKTFEPARSSDVDFHPRFSDQFGLGFLINSTAYTGGRSAGSLAWAGIRNTFYWIDPRRKVCAVLMMQYLPFCDSEAIGLLREFELGVYSGLAT